MFMPVSRKHREHAVGWSSTQLAPSRAVGKASTYLPPDDGAEVWHAHSACTLTYLFRAQRMHSSNRACLSVCRGPPTRTPVSGKAATTFQRPGIVQSVLSSLTCGDCATIRDLSLSPPMPSTRGPDGPAWCAADGAGALFPRVYRMYVSPMERTAFHQGCRPVGPRSRVAQPAPRPFFHAPRLPPDQIPYPAFARLA
jgi:hypothetical protein